MRSLWASQSLYEIRFFLFIWKQKSVLPSLDKCTWFCWLFQGPSGESNPPGYIPDPPDEKPEKASLPEKAPPTEKTQPTGHVTEKAPPIENDPPPAYSPPAQPLPPPPVYAPQQLQPYGQPQQYGQPVKQQYGQNVQQQYGQHVVVQQGYGQPMQPRYAFTPVAMTTVSAAQDTPTTVIVEGPPQPQPTVGIAPYKKKLATIYFK